ncbi:mandelate racemase/muconate lactonizing enzyme family protein [Herbaspirillum sp. 1130]|uniref:mandelate racemase/muconate lactonizing enzyme family protein n=1 Tax=Herbaspirillum sp. 1130 TaxID=2806562 RepID=UPI001AE95188|nr:mandelate racemase/muconate lactonizing enzyme family protein [Herbaspirillum sp. 1130]MBP1318282.1 L-alanine-DL-glutamate epimerase-like enolase superfamily enzyme [Herbaspirillum sp. 1130]
MKINAIDVIELVIPFDDGGRGMGITPGRWDSVDSVLIRIETDTGLVGWGDCFSYVCRTATAAAARDMIRPMLLGRELDATPEKLNHELQKRLHIFGRYGVTLFAISGFDIALWDIAAQHAGKPLHALLGQAWRDQVEAYASLVRYADVELVQHFCRQAVQQGYRNIKLHEIDPEVIRAARRASGPEVGISVDVNCAWDAEQARERLAVMREIDAAWLEEPVFPPEDFETLAALNAEFALGAGENACTRHEFRKMMQAGAVRYPQPSVIKVGGVSEFMAVAHEAQEHGLSVMPHSPYFGPGYFATLHLAAVLHGAPLFEHLYVTLEGDLAQGGTPLPVDGRVTIPQTPGLGFIPDPAILQRYRIA